MKKQIQLLLLLLLFTIYCNGQKVITNDRKSSEIDTLHLFIPMTFIFRNDKIDTTLSHIAKKNLIKGIDEVFPRKISIFDINIDPEYKKDEEKTLYSIMSAFNHKKKDQAAILISDIISQMESLRINFALAIFQIGSSPNGETEITSSSVGKSFMAYTDISCIIFDRQKKNVAFYGKLRLDHSEPCVKRTTDKQLNKLFSKYFELQ